MKGATSPSAEGITYRRMEAIHLRGRQRRDGGLFQASAKRGALDLIGVERME
jgi:hypothetical protein